MYTITDYWSYANRLWTVGSGDVTNTYGTCGVCATSIPGCTDSTATTLISATTDDGSCVYPQILTITTTVCNGAASQAVALTGPAGGANFRVFKSWSSKFFR